MTAAYPNLEWLMGHRKWPFPLHRVHGTQTTGLSTEVRPDQPPVLRYNESALPPLPEHEGHGFSSTNRRLRLDCADSFLRFALPRFFATPQASSSEPIPDKTHEIEGNSPRITSLW